MRRRIILLCLMLVALLGRSGGAQNLPAFPADSNDAEKDGGVSVDAQVNPSRQVPGERLVAEVNYNIPDRWYIFAHSVEVKIAKKDGADQWLNVGGQHQPEPETKYDELLEKQVEYYTGRVTVQRVLSVAPDAPAQTLTVPLQVSYQACSETTCYPPTTRQVEIDVEFLPADSDPRDVNIPATTRGKNSDRASVGAQTEEVPDAGFRDEGLLALLVFSYLAGLALALTPCVYPMIPITMSVIGASSAESVWGGLGRSLVYVLGISLMYATLGLIAAASGSVFGTMMQHPAVYVGLAILFTVLAAAMFDLLSIQLFGTWTNRLQQKVRGRAGLIGILLLGVLSAIALTPCSAPVIIGAMGFVMKTGNLLAGFLAFFCIAWGMGTPLVLVGTFGGMLRSLPESGEWQDTVKHAFGFGLLAAALYFFLHSGLLGGFWSDMVVGGFLVVCSVFAGAFDRLAPDSSWWPRLCKSVGLLLLIAAVFVFGGAIGWGGALPEKGEGIEWEPSLMQARRKSREQDKPMMIYFWQEMCPSCEQLVQSTFPDPAVVERSDEFVCVKFDGTDAQNKRVKKVLNRYGVKGFPTLVFVDSSGQSVKDATRVGYVPPGELVQVMEQVVGGKQPKPERK